MTITVDDVRRDWLAQLETINPTITNLEAGNLIYQVGSDPMVATAAWLSKLHRDRAGLEELLRLFPGSGTSRQ